MGTQYRYRTHDGGPPNDGIPPGLEPPQGPPFGHPFPYVGPSPFGAPPSWPNPFGPPTFGQHPGFCQPPPNIVCFGGQGPPPGPNSMVCFSTSGPPPYTENPWHMAGPPAPSIANKRPPSGAYVNGQIIKLKNGQGLLLPKDSTTTFHLILNGVKPWDWSTWSPRGTCEFSPYEVLSTMAFDEFCDAIDAIKKAPCGTPREQVGVQEAIEMGDGQFRAGAAYRLGDSRIMYQKQDGTYAYKTLEQLGWSADRGKVGRGKPVTIALLP